MSKHSSSGRVHATSQMALTHRQRRRPRGEVYRQPPRVRTRTQLAVQSLDTAPLVALRAPEPGMLADMSATDMGATDAALAALHPSAVPLGLSGATGAGVEVASLATPPDMLEATPDASQSPPRLPRRTRTLADVVQPRRDPALSSGSLSIPSAPSAPSIPSPAPSGPLSDPAPAWPDPATAPLALADEDADSPEPVSEELPSAGAEMLPASELINDEPQTAPLAALSEQDPLGDADHDTSDTDGDTSGALTDTPRHRAASTPIPRPARTDFATRPVAAVAEVTPRAPLHTRPLAGNPWGANPAGLKDDDDVPARFRRAARRGSPPLVRHMALGHAVAGMVLAVVASALVLLAQPVGVWLLGLAALALAGGGLAALLLWWRRAARAAVVVLALGQMGALAWGCALVGPRAALLVLVAPAVALALRGGGRPPALVAGSGMVAVYAAFQIAASQALQPVFAPPPLALAAGDTFAVTLGLGLLLAELAVAAAIRARSEAAARARLYEIRLLRERIGALRGEVEEGGEWLDTALTQALRGRGLDPIAVDGPLSLVARSINAAAERLRTLQQDREDRLRLESAVRALARALERGWLGVPWTWPEPSGTLLDEVVVLLRTPRPADSLASAPIERRASPHSGPLAPPPGQFAYESSMRSATGSGVFGTMANADGTD